MRRAVALAALACALAAACVSTAPDGRLTRELAGEWRGRMVTARGQTAATMIVKEDGAYAGTLYFDGVDRAFHGAIVEVRPGELRYAGSEGDGAVRLGQETGGAVLRFVGDDGATGARFIRQP